MSYEYRVVTLSETGGIPSFTGGRVSKQDNVPGCFTVYGPAVNRREPTIAVLYRDPSGKYLVGAEPDVLSKLTGAETLNAVVNKGLSGWHTWKCNTDKGEVVIQTSKMSSGVSKTKPVVDSGKNIYGGIPTATFGLDKFQPVEIEKQVTWIGDKTAVEVEIVK